MEILVDIFGDIWSGRCFVFFEFVKKKSQEKSFKQESLEVWRSFWSITIGFFWGGDVGHKKTTTGSCFLVGGFNPFEKY